MSEGGSTPLAEDISADAVAELLAAGESALVDVREDDEWAGGHVGGATHIPLSELEANPWVLSRRLGVLPIAFICRSGKRSAKAASLVAAEGGRTVRNVEGGMKAWVAADLPIVPRDGEIV